MKNYFLNETCFVISLGDNLSQELNDKALLIYSYFKKNNNLLANLNIVDIVPTYNSVAFHLNPLMQNAVLDLRQNILSRVKEALPSNYNWQKNISEHKIEVSYSGMDIDSSLEKLNLSKAEFIRLHTEPTYQIAMLGFKPYLPYLLGLNEKLAMPRLESPRTRIPAGSVGIGGAQTSIFPVEMPCGWHIIGSSDFNDFKQFKPGDRVKFNSI